MCFAPRYGIMFREVRKHYTVRGASPAGQPGSDAQLYNRCASGIMDRTQTNITKERKSAIMKRNSFLTLVALAVAAVGVVIGLAAYFKNRSSYLYDDDDFLFDDPDDLEYYPSIEEDAEAEPSGDEDGLKF